MKTPRIILGVILACVGFIASSVIFYYGWQMKALTQVAQVEPQQLTAADLIKSGAGDNLHIELSDYVFGKPVIDESNGKWDRVWVPIHPKVGSKKKPGDPVVFFRSTAFQNQNELDEFLKQATLKVFVANTHLNKSYWGANISSGLYLAYPKMDIDKITILSEPVMRVPGTKVVLNADVLMNPAYSKTALGVSCCLLMVGFVGSFFIASHEQKVRVEEAVCRVNKSESGTGVTTRHLSQIPGRVVNQDEVKRQRELLKNEPEQSTHDFKAFGFIRNAMLAIFVVIVSLIIVAAILTSAVPSAKELGPIAAAGMGVLTLIACTFIMAVIAWNLDMYFHRASRIQVCTSGLRWLRGGDARMASWLEIASVERVSVDTNVQRTAMASQFGLIGALAASMAECDHANLKRTADTTTIVLQNGDRIYVSMDSLTEYRWFADSVFQWHGTEAKRFDASHSINALSRAVVMPGRSNQTMMNYGR